jgi:cell division protein FtsB
VRAYLKRLHLGMVLGVVVAVYITVYLVGTIKHNYDMQKDIAALQQQIADLQLEKDQLQYKIQYYQTEAYKEKEARAKLGLQAPGESVIILPHDDPATPTAKAQTANKPKKSNWQQWWDFLLGRA